MQHEAEPQESQDGEMVVHMVRHHGDAPLHGLIGKHFSRFWGWRNYPQERGTHPSDRGENIGIAVLGQRLYCINDLETISVGQKRPIASEAPVKTDRGVGLYLDVAVALF
jgi:hypothetical protein